MAINDYDPYWWYRRNPYYQWEHQWPTYQYTPPKDDSLYWECAVTIPFMPDELDFLNKLRSLENACKELGFTSKRVDPSNYEDQLIHLSGSYDDYGAALGALIVVSGTIKELGCTMRSYSLKSVQADSDKNDVFKLL